MMRAGSRVTLNAQRFAQVGTWSGTLLIDGEETAVSPDRWVGTRDRSWGIRPVGEAEPEGAPSDPPFEGMWWTYVPMRFEEYAVVLILQEDPDGYRTLNDCHRVWRDGRIEQLGWPQVDDPLRLGHPRSRPVPRSPAPRPTASRSQLEVESLLPVPIHIGGGYGGDPDWIHGQWKGAGFTERVTYDLTDESVAGRIMFGVIDHAARAVCHEGVDGAEGFGLFEHGALGRHDPSGFADWFTLAP